MRKNYELLSTFIQTISEQTNMHICIHDISGITDLQQLSIHSHNGAHSKDFCTIAKSTPKGFRLCIDCKMRANKKAITDKALYYGYCPYGLFEIVKPVIIEGKSQCIIYIGNLTFDVNESANKIHRACKITKAPEQKLLKHIKETQIVKSIDHYIQLANIIDSYMRLLYEQCKFQKNEGKQHWIVSTLQNYIEKNYNQNISLQNVSKLYFVNDKYVGRLFKKQMGCTFHEYLNNIRLDNAIDLLLHTNESIITIAMNSGFQNVTYFNRLFLRKYNVSPTTYRKIF